MSSSSESGGGLDQKRSGQTSAEDSETSSVADSADLHGSQHEMHRTIERRSTSFEDVQKLLDRGETFCRGDGLNCFVLATACAWTSGPQRWDLLTKMLEVDPRGIRTRDQNDRTLLFYFIHEQAKLKQLIKLGADLNNVDKSGRTLIDDICRFSFEEGQYGRYWPLWEMLLQHKEIQNQVRTGGCFEYLVQNANNKGGAMLCSFLRTGLMSVGELTERLQMHPLFFIIQLNRTESVYLLLYIWDNSPDKNENVAALGADLNIVDSTGKSLLECLFSPAILKVPNFNLTELWDILIKNEDIQRQASKEGFLRSLWRLTKNSSDHARHFFEEIFQLGIWSVEQLTTELKMHPLFCLVELADGEPSYFLELMKTNPCFIKDKKDITIVTKIYGCSRYVSGKERFKHWLNITQEFTLDIFGHFLSTIYFSYITSLHYNTTENEALSQCLTTLLENGFVPSQGVVHPVHALLYNIFLNFENLLPPIDDLSAPDCNSEPQQILDILLKTMTIFKDFPIPHKFLPDPEILDVHLLLSPMLCPALVFDSSTRKTLFEVIMALLQLSPFHPLQHFASFYKYSSCNFEFVNGAFFLQAFCMLLRLTLEASGKHRFQGVDQPTLQCISSFCEFVNNIQIHPNEPQEISLHRKAAVKVKSEVGSLQWLSILQIRKTLFLNRSSTTITLPSLIRGLVAERHLPQGLEADVLVYKPNDCIIKF